VLFYLINLDDMKKKTLIIGATTNTERYAYTAAVFLNNAAQPFELFGIKKGEVLGKQIQNEFPENHDFHTLTLYLSPNNQKAYYDKILNIKPQRIIFNPGTENPELAQLAREKGIETVNACTLVLLNTNQY
jgi:predicted CoA-binding protein